MEIWRKVWRDGFAPVLSTAGLELLNHAIELDDPRLMQGGTTQPAPMQSVMDWPAEGACAIGFCGWQGDGHETVGEVDESFARACFEADMRLGEPTACRWFLTWYDDVPREELLRELGAEVSRELSRRASHDWESELEELELETVAA